MADNKEGATEDPSRSVYVNMTLVKKSSPDKDWVSEKCRLENTRPMDRMLSIIRHSTTAKYQAHLVGVMTADESTQFVAYGSDADDARKKVITFFMERCTAYVDGSRTYFSNVPTTTWCVNATIQPELVLEFHRKWSMTWTSLVVSLAPVFVAVGAYSSEKGREICVGIGNTRRVACQDAAKKMVHAWETTLPDHGPCYDKIPENVKAEWKAFDKSLPWDTSLGPYVESKHSDNLFAPSPPSSPSSSSSSPSPIS